MSWCRSSASIARRRPTNLFLLSTCRRPPSPPKALRIALTFKSRSVGPNLPPQRPRLSPGDRMKRSASREHFPR